MKKLYNQIINSQLFRTIFDEQVLLIIAGLVVVYVVKIVPEFEGEPWLPELIMGGLVVFAGLRNAESLLREFVVKHDVAAIVQAVLDAFEVRFSTDIPDAWEKGVVGIVDAKEKQFEATIENANVRIEAAG